MIRQPISDISRAELLREIRQLIYRGEWEATNTESVKHMFGDMTLMVAARPVTKIFRLGGRKWRVKDHKEELPF